MWGWKIPDLPARLPEKVSELVHQALVFSVKKVGLVLWPEAPLAHISHSQR